MISKTVSYILDHSDAKVLIVDRQFKNTISKALENFNKKIIIIDINDKQINLPDGGKIGDLEYESF